MISKSEILFRVVDLEMQMIEIDERLNKLEKLNKNKKEIKNILGKLETMKNSGLSPEFDKWLDQTIKFIEER